ncbi:uncharacterized, partial [Tachysurus ichikawai]
RGLAENNRSQQQQLNKLSAWFGPCWRLDKNKERAAALTNDQRPAAGIPRMRKQHKTAPKTQRHEAKPICKPVSTTVRTERARKLYSEAGETKLWRRLRPFTEHLSNTPGCPISTSELKIFPFS